MKKLYVALGLLAAVLALAVGLGPWYTSRIADRQITATVDALNRQGIFQAHYDRIAYNWFGQQGTLKLIPVDPRISRLQRNGPREIVLRLSVAYGPIPFAAWQRDGVSLMPVGAVIDTRIDGLDRALRKAGSGYRLRDVVKLNGDNAFRLNVEPGSATGAKGERVQWTASELRLDQRGQHISGAGHSGEVTVTGDAPSAPRIHIAPLKLAIDDVQVIDNQSAGRYSLSWGGMQASGPQRKRGTTLALNVGKMQLKADTHFAQGIVAGKADMAVAGFSVREPADAETPQFSMKDMTLNSVTTDPQNDYTGSTVRWNVADISAKGQHYSPATIEMRLEHLYVPAMRDTVKALQDLQRNMRAQRDIPPQLVFQRMAGVLMPPLQQLIEHQPVLRLTQFHLGTPNGALQGKGEARIAPANGATPSLTTLPEDLVAQFTLDIPGQLAHQIAGLAMSRQGVPASQLAETSQRYLDRLQSQGFLHRQGSDYSLEFDYRNSTLLLNGRPVWRG
ncbi:YdgA family protein [Acidihalobacter prosperus]